MLERTIILFYFFPSHLQQFKCELKDIYGIVDVINYIMCPLFTKLTACTEVHGKINLELKR